MYCENCGALLTGGGKFCPECGAAVNIKVQNKYKKELHIFLRKSRLRRLRQRSKISPSMTVTADRLRISLSEGLNPGASVTAQRMIWDSLIHRL